MPEEQRRGALRWVWLLALGIWAWVAWPLASGERTLYFRDVFETHLHFKAYGAEQLRQGRIPALNTSWGLGQPFRGNPNTLPFYPGNLLYLVLPFWSAFNLHFVLHWLLALVAMHRLARELGLGSAGALAAGLSYAGSGWLLSAMSFYNLLTVAAWWPLVMWGVLRGDRRGIAVAASSCGMALYGGEPVTAALGLVPLLWLAVARHGVLGGFWRSAAAGALGLLVALPQVVATARVVGFSSRGARGVELEELAAYAFHPLRLLELLVPFPFGSPAVYGAAGYLQSAFVPQMPYMPSISYGLVGLGLALVAARRHRSWALLALLGMLLAYLGGVFPGAMMQLTGGFFRYPEKLLLWSALLIPLLIGAGIESPFGRRQFVLLGGLAGFLATVGVVCWWLPESGFQGVPDTLAEVVAANRHLWGEPLLLGAAFLALAVWALARGWPALAVAGLLVSQLALYPLLMTDRVEPYRQPGPWTHLLPEGAGVVVATAPGVNWEPQQSYDLAGPRAISRRIRAVALDPSPGVLNGLSYPLAPDLEGMQSPLLEFLSRNLIGRDWEERLRWCRALGVEALVTHRPLGGVGVEELGRLRVKGKPHFLYRVERPAPVAWWPSSVVVAANPIAALTLARELDDLVSQVVISAPVVHRPAARVSVLEDTPDRLRIEVRGEGGMLAVRRAFRPAWRAHSGGEELAIQLLDVALVGIEVPPGRQEIELSIAAWPEIVAGAFAGLVTLGLLLSALWRPRSGQS